MQIFVLSFTLWPLRSRAGLFLFFFFFLIKKKGLCDQLYRPLPLISSKMLDEINKLLTFQCTAKHMTLRKFKKTGKRTQPEAAARALTLLLAKLDNCHLLPAVLNGVVADTADLSARESFAWLKNAALKGTWVLLEALVEEARMLEFSNTVEALEAEGAVLARTLALLEPACAMASENMAEQLLLFERIKRARDYEAAFAAFRALSLPKGPQKK